MKVKKDINSCSQLQTNTQWISHPETPIKYNTLIIDSSIHLFLSRLYSAMEEIVLDSETGNNNLIEIPQDNYVKMTSSDMEENESSLSLMSSSISGYEGSYYFNEQHLLDNISELALE